MHHYGLIDGASHTWCSYEKGSSDATRGSDDRNTDAILASRTLRGPEMWCKVATKTRLLTRKRNIPAGR